MYRFLAHPRWIGFAVLVVLTIVACLLLARWQWTRLEQRERSSALITANSEAPTVTPDELLVPGRPLPDGEQWRTVAVTGRYDADAVRLVRKRVLNSRPGFYVLTPIRAGSGAGLWINRGWIPAADTATAPPDPPPVPAGTVTVTARVRPTQGEFRAAPGELPPGQVDRIDVVGLSADLDYPTYGAYGEAISEAPATVPAPETLPPPDLGDGPHLSYAVQWVTFALVAVVGWYVLIRKEAERLAEERDPRPAGGPDPDADTDMDTAQSPSSDQATAEGDR